jgi:hypothetical protein
MSTNHPGEGSEHGPQPAVAMGKWITKPIKVIVTPKAGGNANQIDCDLTPGDHASAPYVPDTDTIKLPVNEGPFRIQFELAGGLEWNEDNPFNTSRAAGCPPGNKKANDDEQIFRQPADKTTLTVLNLNDGNPIRIQFRMNFANGTYCDPIMDNSGRT